MRAKTFGLFALSIFALIFLMSAASANIVFTNVTGNGANVTQGNTAIISFQLFEDTTGGGAATGISFNTPITLTSGTNTFNSTSTVTGAITTLNQDATSTVMSLSFNVLTNQAVGTYTGTLQPTGTYTATFVPLTVTLTVTSTIPSEIQSCTATGNPGDLKVKKIDFANNGMQYNTFGEDDEWFPFEEIEAEIELENNGDDNVDDISLQWGIYDTRNGRWVIDIDEEDEFNLKDGDEQTATVTFKIDDDMDVDLDELDDGAHYRFYVVAEGTVDNETSPDTCAYDFESASVIIESDFVILDNIKMPETLGCGETATITADVWNIGDSDQDEVSVYVEGRESALEFSKTIEVGDIDAFDKQALTFTFTVPKNLEEKFYALNFEVKDEDGDVYENDFDDDLSEFSVPFEVKGNCGAAEEVVITATIVSGGRAGDELVIKATITNNEDELKTFTINAAEFATWADSVSLDQNTLVLNAGESRDVLFTFDVKKDAVGSQTFFIELVSGEEVTRQAVSVSIEPRAGFLTGAAISENWPLWGLGLLNIILVVVIIIVAVRVARRR